MVKYSKSFLSKLEDLIAEGGYLVRYEKGNFRSGYCVLNENKLVLINNFLTIEGRINCLVDLILHLNLNRNGWSEKSIKLFDQLLLTEKSKETHSAKINSEA